MYSFCARVVSVWKSMPDNEILATSVNSFKNRLDKLWDNQDIVYNLKAQLTRARLTR